MGKNKLRRFAELDEFDRVFQPGTQYRDTNFHLKGKWRQEVFQNNNDIVVELGCGRGEYTVNLAERYPNKNFIGIDKKGARLWRGAKTSNENRLYNSAFLRVQIASLNLFFAPQEINEIWITFPDPQPQLSREKNRMTSPAFLKMYKNLLTPGGIVHLKTDNVGLFDYTLEKIQELNLVLLEHTHDLYHSNLENETLQIKTTYEQKFLKEGMNICYLKFRYS